MQIGPAQGQRAQMHYLARLVDGLVGGQQDLVGALEGDLLGNRVTEFVVAGTDDQVVGARLEVGHGEAGPQRPPLVGAPEEKLPGMRSTAFGNADRDHCTRGRLPLFVISDHHAQRGAAAGKQFVRANDLNAQGVQWRRLPGHRA